MDNQFTVAAMGRTCMQGSIVHFVIFAFKLFS